MSGGRNTWDDLKTGDHRLFSLLKIDIVGHSAITERANPVLMRETLDAFLHYVEACSRRHDGRRWGWQGDGGYLAFYENPDRIADSAVACALEILEGLDDYNTQIPIADRIDVRLAAHTGLIEYRDDPGTIYGEPMNFVAHLEADKTKTLPNTISASEDHVRRLIDYRDRFVENGEFEGKAVYTSALSPGPEEQKGDGGRDTTKAATDQGARHAVIVGISHYEDAAIPDLKYAAEDALHFGDALVELGRFPDENVAILTDSDATLRNIKLALSNLREAPPEDFIVIYFAGHGCPDVHMSAARDRDELTWKYLVPYDAERSSLLATGLMLDDFQRILSLWPCDHVAILLDSCYSGMGERSFAEVSARGTFTDSILEDLSGEGRVVLAASGPTELAFEADHLGHGIFTHHVLEGLRGKADADQDGIIDISDLYAYLSDRVPVEAERLGGRQHPVLKGDPALGRVLTFPQPGPKPEAEPEPDLFAEVERLYNSGSYADLCSLLEGYLTKAGPRAGDANVWIGKACAASGQVQRAREAFASAVARAPANPEAHHGLGSAHLQQGDIDSAIESFRRAAVIDADHGSGLFEVQYRLEEALTQSPDDPATLLRLAKVNALTGTADAALEYLRRAVEQSNPEGLEALELELRGVAFLALRRDSGLETVLRLIGERRDAQQRYLALLGEAEAALASADLETASEAYRTCSELNPGAEAPTAGLDAIAARREELSKSLQEAREYLDDAAYEDALRSIDRALAIDRGSREAISLQAQATEQIRRDEEVAELLSAARDLETRGEFAQARDKIARAIDLCPSSGDLIDELRRVEGAIQRRAKLNDLLTQADVHENEGRLEDARETLSDAIQLSPDDADLQQRAADLDARIRGRDLRRFMDSAHCASLVATAVKAGRPPSSDEVAQAVRASGLLPLEPGEALAQVRERWQEGHQRLVSEHVRRARGFVSAGNSAAATSEVAQIRRLDRYAAELAKLETELNDLETRQAALTKLIRDCRGLLQKQAYDALRDRIQSVPALAAGNRELARLLRQATSQIRSLKSLRRTLDQVAGLEADGKLSDALYLLLRIKQRTQQERQLAKMVTDLGDSVQRKLREEEAKAGSDLPSGMVPIGTGHFVLGVPDRKGSDTRGSWCYCFLDAFAIDTRPVTNEQYRAFLSFMTSDENHDSCCPEEPQGKDHTPAGWDALGDGDDSKPVVGVDWFDAYAYAAWAGKRLPTEAEWERASFWDEVTGRKMNYPWGDDFREGFCNCAGSGENGPSPVGGSEETMGPCGLLHASGNVWEWCLDQYASRYIPGSRWVRQPTGPEFADARVIRGGSWVDPPEEVGIRARSQAYPQTRTPAIGFRCALSLSLDT